MGRAADRRRSLAGGPALLPAAGVLAAAALPAAAQLGPKPGKCGIGCWGGNVSGQQQLAVSFIADFDISPSILREGQRFRGRVTVFRDDLLLGCT